MRRRRKQYTGCGLAPCLNRLPQARQFFSRHAPCPLDFFQATCATNHGAPQCRSGVGNVYAAEGNHWYVTFYDWGGC
ncbi:hypothetical protein ACFUJR_25485 [Streptomyces sp. NPDC057271]|uniref:hypothetical protein n=1 Tax=unclassified Streptomyces TaxID=2593676 RepID=UPI0036321A28